MSIYINKDTKVITQGITGKTGQFHTRGCRDYANGRNCFVAGVNPKKAGEDFEGIPIFDTVKEAVIAQRANVSMIFVPASLCADAILEAVEAGIKLVIAKNIEKIYGQNCQNIGLLTSTDFSLLPRIERGEARIKGVSWVLEYHLNHGPFGHPAEMP